jgi:3-phosphoshikimate 1-carboxyvinyltransferase
LADIIVKRTESLSGTVKAPPSKAYTHRALIAASLSEGASTVKNALICDDTLATVEACRMLGAEIEETESGNFKVHGRPKPQTPRGIINCRDSGSTIRFLMPVCALVEGMSVLTGGESLYARPMNPLLEALRQLGVQCYSTRMDGYPPIVVFGGGIKGGKATIRGDVSSQFISGLLFATPLAQGETEIALSTSLESKPYVTITLDILRRHAIKVEPQCDYGSFHIPCGQSYRPSDHVVEGDYSSAAFILGAAAVTNSRLTVENLKEDTAQGDRMIVDILGRMGVLIEAAKGSIEIKGAEGSLKAVDVDLRDHPDLVPICTVLACVAKGKSVIRGFGRLRFKESDRIDALTSELTKLGAEIRVVEDRLEVLGGKKLRGTELDSHRDHRIAMACAVAALTAKGDSVVHGIECINKSYPHFVMDLRALGGKVVER